MAVNKSITKDIKFYKRVLHKSQQRFLEDLDPVSILDLFLERDYLPYTQVRDIQEQKLTSEKTREIIKRVSAKGVGGYKTFKALLRESHQEHLAEFLDKQEKEIKMAEKKKEEKDKQARARETVAPVQPGNQRIPDEQELTSISAHIGRNWELLGPFLGVPTVTIDHIKSDNSTTQVQIYKMLEAWRSKDPLAATVDNLLSAMNRAPSSVNIEWDAIRETVGLYSSIDRKTEDLHQSLGARPKSNQIPLQSNNEIHGETQVIDDFGMLNLQSQNPSNGIQETPTRYTSVRGVRTDIPYTPLGNTRVNDPDVSNRYGPDMSNVSVKGGSDGRKESNTRQGDRQHYALATDELDARREQTSEEVLPSIPTPTIGQSLHEINQKLDKALTAKEQHVTTPQSRQAPQAIVDDVDGYREKEKERLRKELEKEREKRLHHLFTSEDDIKGRLKVLGEQNVEDLLDCCGPKKGDLDGGFGDIFISKEKIPGLDIKIVIKKVMLNNEADDVKMRSITSEKLASRTMHFAIVPLLALREDAANMTYYFLSPYLENGDLFRAIQTDNTRLKDKKSVILDIEKRLRILFQVASAIDFLHTPVEGFREIILHMDIKTPNIVLDKYYNARLIDFGLAREMREGEQHINTTTRELAHTEGYFRTMKGQKLTRHADYFNFGVVIRELSTGLPFYDHSRKEDEQLKRMNDLEIASVLLEMWRHKRHPSSEAQKLIDLSVKCIEDVVECSSKDILKEISAIVRDKKMKRWTPRQKSSEKTKDDPRCEMCLAFPAVKDKILEHGCSCKCNIKVCVPCMRNVYVNPIKCHSCDTDIRTIIGQDWGAVLIAGNDTDRDWAACFKKDVQNIKTITTSKWPLVMGISETHVKTIYPKEAGKDECLKDELKSAISSLNKKEDIRTILIYFSGHYYPDKENLTRVFKFGGENEFLSLDELQLMLSPFVKGSNDSKLTAVSSRRFIVFFDCCYAPSFVASPGEKEEQSKGASGLPFESSDTQRLEKKYFPSFLSFGKTDNYSIVQINACRPFQTAKMKPDGSIFTNYVVQALTRKALKKRCYLEKANSNFAINADVETCTDCGLKGDFVTMQNLLDYLTEHLEKDPSSDSSIPVINAHNVSAHDAKIGYVVNFSADMTFTYSNSNTKTQGDIPTEMFTDMVQLKTVLYIGFFDEMIEAEQMTEPRPSPVDFLDMLCIEVQKGPKKHHRDELNTLEKISGAWYSKRELVVSLREISEIRFGKVGVFLPTGCPFSDFLKRNDFVKKREESSGLTYSVAENNLRNLLCSTREMDVTELNRNLSSVVSAVEKAKKLYGIRVAELRIIFPVKEDGVSLLRDDFVCFEMIQNV